jgi:multiple sugar transport system permease protein
MAHLWKEMPFASILFLAGLQTIPQELYDASRVDGATSKDVLFKITLPLLKPVLLVVAIYETIVGLVTFDLVYVMTGGGPGDSTSLISWYTYAETFKFLNLGRGAALSIVLAGIILLMVMIYLRTIRIEEIY